MSAPDLDPFEETEMLRLSRQAVGKVDRFGKRGVTLVTMEEIEAMATTLACLGVVPDRINEGKSHD